MQIKFRDPLQYNKGFIHVIRQLLIKWPLRRGILAHRTCFSGRCRCREMDRCREIEMPERKKAADLERWRFDCIYPIVVVYLCNDCEEMLTLIRLRKMQRKCGVNDNKIQR